MRHFIAIVTLIAFAIPISRATAATPEQAGTYSGTASMTYLEPDDGKKVKTSDSITMTIEEDNTIIVTLGTEEYTSDSNPIYATGGGFRGGSGANGFAFTIFFEFKGKKAIKGTMHFISPYGTTTGKVKMKKIIM